MKEIEKGLKDVINALISNSNFDEYDYYKEVLLDSKETMELFFDNYFRNVESWVYSHDKAAYTVARIIKAIESKNNLSLQETYDIAKDPQMKKYEGEIAYWCPKTLKDTDEAIDIYYGVLSFHFEKLNEKIKNKEQK
jgi:hypothetical protein